MDRNIEAKLLAWKGKTEGRMPLILEGARQVGKTYILRKFGEENFANTVYVNLEADQNLASFFAESISSERLIRYLEASSGERITAGETLIILDEIQASERALTSLKYFCEEAPAYHVAAAGSLLGVAVNRSEFSFPVGKVETLKLYPLNFEEFLWALGKKALAEEIRTAFETLELLPGALHAEATELYREYLIVGGMPACVNAFAASKSLLDAVQIQSGILANYVADMAKYASALEAVKIRTCFDSIPAQLAKDNRKFQYKVAQRGGTAAIFGVSIEWLKLAGIALKCKRISEAVEPISVYEDPSAFKLYMGDVGLLTMKSGISRQTILSGEGNTFMGALTENYVAEELTSSGHELRYWESKGKAELDFVLQSQSDIIGIEVKKGEHVRSRSLNEFIRTYKPARSFRLSLKNFGNSGEFDSVPLYAAFCI